MQTLLAAGMLALALTGPGPAHAAQIESVVIGHGALADGSGWCKVFDRLTTKGYNVPGPSGQFFSHSEREYEVMRPLVQRTQTNLVACGD